jgi:hypothetical protein
MLLSQGKGIFRYHSLASRGVRGNKHLNSKDKGYAQKPNSANFCQIFAAILPFCTPYLAVFPHSICPNLKNQEPIRFEDKSADLCRDHTPASSPAAHDRFLLLVYGSRV